jgi:hypothetical protein
MFAGKRCGKRTLPSLTTMTRASRRRASWRIARSTMRTPPMRICAPVASAAVARRITGMTVAAAGATGPVAGTTVRRAIDLSCLAL